jgi:hypothetical protein
LAAILGVGLVAVVVGGEVPQSAKDRRVVIPNKIVPVTIQHNFVVVLQNRNNKKKIGLGREQMPHPDM